MFCRISANIILYFSFAYCLRYNTVKFSSKACLQNAHVSSASQKKSFLNTCSSVPKIPRDQNTTPGTKTTVTQHQLPPLFFSPVNNGIAIKRSI
ncbi:hypothetical protein T11_3296 [Trichinella zimbabwensis]|uniref:Uncharacterized protein n=1 Tax=Trichinella zimbabwensis TaxID=268475 RepID=A0A0V1GT57_9BILA|nr:hypothetical protein T11_3296 [Trichinella zimbabwensis]